MMTVAAEPTFLDTNILVYATIDSSPMHSAARAAISAFESAHTQLWISRQVLREFLSTLARPRVGIPITELTATIRQFETRFRIAEDGPLVTAQLLLLLEQGHTRQVHDTNIVATMLATGITHMLTNNPADFSVFANLIKVTPLQT
jgi:predicted nucleic acid-binding protein